MIQQHIVTNFRGLADHDRGAMIDEEAPTDARARMDLDERERTHDLGDQARQERHPRPEERVREPVPEHRVDGRVGQQDFQAATRRGILAADTADGFKQIAKQETKARYGLAGRDQYLPGLDRLQRLGLLPLFGEKQRGQVTLAGVG